MEAQLIEIKNMINSLSTKVSEIRQELKGLVEVQQRLIHVQLGAPIPPKPKEFGEETSSSGAKIQISNNTDGKTIKITGKTYDYMACIKECGNAKFDKDTKSWNLPIDAVDTLVKKLKSMNLVEEKDFTVKVVKPTVDDNTSMFD